MQRRCGRRRKNPGALNVVGKVRAAALKRHLPTMGLPNIARLNHGILPASQAQASGAHKALIDLSDTRCYNHKS
jgi:hypothetical protein